ncbi:MAG: hypothetical protein E6R04_11955 [Spirochaetes bacterium]|nr:MAG: hypothetical protein E6R04_11955 [Spirochaetota bacterium]
MPKFKVCGTCKKHLEIKFFRKDGYEYVCKNCKVDKRGKYRNIGVQDFVDIPILLNFDSARVIGLVRIDPKYAKMFPNVSFSAGYIQGKNGKANELISIGLIPAENSVYSDRIK